MAKIEGLLFDLSGVLYEGERPVPGAVEALEALKKRYPMRFITNTTRKTPRKVWEKLEGMGFDVAPEAVFTALDAARRTLETRGAKGRFLVYRDVAAWFDDLRSDRPDYVVVADAYDDFTYQNLNAAFRDLMAGAKLMAVAKNRYFKDADGDLSLDAGGFVTLLEFASGQSAEIVGKPAAPFFREAAASMRVDPAHVLMVGDDIESDIAGAQRAGMRACLVKTGKFRSEDLKREIRPDYLIGSVAELPELLERLAAETSPRFPST
ncbi:TIGR01458 family HAD-type hydrolase [Hydrogenimonas sp. SS33]|uniref:TIGR01458 family HAD-type hydrolase n=1 Tax=Hydrogenimonas leucolamina TaxID=2954236 RepID=UPI00336BF9F0